MNRARPAARLTVAAGSLGMALALPLAAPASADPSWRVVASDLHSPRGLATSPDGEVYVAESGHGGDGPCTVHHEIGEVCLGDSGAITWVNPSGKDEQVVTGLPSIAGEHDALGPMDLVVTGGGRYVASIGLGGDVELRDAFGDDGSHLGTLVSGPLDSDRRRVVADLLAFEAEENPDGAEVDTNPAGIARAGEGFVVADAGGNALLRTDEDGHTRTVAVLDPTEEGAQSVPTAVVRGPDGAWYVSQLTGFPFTKGAASIWRVTRDGETSVYASGLTNVTDLAFKDETLYAVQIASEGLLNGPIGSLVEVPEGSTSPTVVVGGLMAPYGVVVSGNAAYVSVCSVCMSDGQVIRVRLG